MTPTPDERPEATTVRIRRALMRVATNVAKHEIQRSGWSSDDECFLIDLRDSESEIEQLIDDELRPVGAIVADRDRLLAACKVALARLQQLGAEDDIETIGPCPACEAIRTALAGR